MISWLEKESAIPWVIVLCIAVFIFYVSSVSFKAGQANYDFLPFIYHFSVFFLFGLFLMIALARGENSAFFFLATIIAIVYGISDEIHQIFVPGRSASVYDILVDSFGIFYAMLIYSISIQYRKNGKIGN